MQTLLLFLAGVAIAVVQLFVSRLVVTTFLRGDGLSEPRMRALAGGLAYSWYFAEVVGALLVRVHLW